MSGVSSDVREEVRKDQIRFQVAGQKHGKAIRRYFRPILPVLKITASSRIDQNTAKVLERVVASNVVLFPIVHMYIRGNVQGHRAW